ncbi:flagellar FliJ family protein [Helicobacter bizzozeronii]|uniref:flagellar FliJ family protein n=1 Tax=Helicobacter bizzozeronii TaxID=56877 RepID=UPI000CF12D46|nr:flagellar FliJ family protein [Helicobacter bizzozeronii]
MDTFKSLVKIKHQIAQRYESDMIHNQNQIRRKQEEQQELLAQLHDLSLPTCGGCMEFKQLGALKKNYLYMIDEINSEISKLRKVGLHLQDLHKAAMLEYEKVKYLQTLEIQKQKQKLKKLEDKQMDAIGMGVFYQNQKGKRV